MSIFIDKDTRVVIQGITGKEGSKIAGEMSRYGTKVCAGVTPGRGGTETDLGVPIFNSVHEALSFFPEINTSLIAVPAKFGYEAACEAVGARIPLINILTEGLPVFQVARLLRQAEDAGVQIVGPSSVGIISPGKAKLGSIGGGGLDTTTFCPGSVGVVSKSGGMTSEISRVLTMAGLGQSTALGIGGDILIGTGFAECALIFERDDETKALVIFGEIGGGYEEQLADRVLEGTVTKPIVALIAGKFGATLPSGTTLGHAGAIVNKGRGSFSGKVAILRKAGISIAGTPEEIPGLIKDML